MRMLRVAVSELRSGDVVLDHQASHYLVHVHRAAAGTRFVAFDVGSATEGLAQLVVADTRQARCRIGTVVNSTRVPRHRLVVVQGLGKGDRADQVVRDATALDATEVWMVFTERSAIRGRRGDADSRSKHRSRTERWRRIAVEAARQCERGNIPTIHEPVTLAEALRGLSDFNGCRWVLNPSAAISLANHLAGLAPTDAVLLVGPEGGLDDFELDAAHRAGLVDARLGPRVLRTETATLAALGVIAAWRDANPATSG
jgi:16S rRNA (uracil1498-N3)-methyltransferase